MRLVEMFVAELSSGAAFLAIVQAALFVGGCLWFYRRGRRDAIDELFENSEVSASHTPPDSA